MLFVRWLPPVPCVPPFYWICGSVLLRWGGGGGGGGGRYTLKLRLVLCGLLLLGLLKIRVLFPFTDTLGGLLCFVYLDKPVAGHFLRDFITRLILSYGCTPPIRALARAQYSIFSSIPI